MHPMTDNESPPTLTLTNGQVAEALGLSESGVSRLRSGDRLPSLAVMQQIEATYGWTVQGQSNARRDGEWHTAFGAVLATTVLEQSSD